MLTKFSFGIALVLCVSCSSDTASTTVQDETDLGAPADFGQDTTANGESDGSSMNADSGGEMEPDPCVPTRMNLCCNSDADCPGGKERWFLNPESSYCNDSGICIECETDEDCGVGSRCDPFGRGICSEPLPCEIDADCGAGTEVFHRVCDVEAQNCRSCRSDDECELSQICYPADGGGQYSPLLSGQFDGCIDREKVEVSCLRDQCNVYCRYNGEEVFCPNKDPGEDMGM